MDIRFIKKHWGWGVVALCLLLFVVVATLNQNGGRPAKATKLRQAPAALKQRPAVPTAKRPAAKPKPKPRPKPKKTVRRLRPKPPKPKQLPQQRTVTVYVPSPPRTITVTRTLPRPPSKPKLRPKPKPKPRPKVKTLPRPKVKPKLRLKGTITVMIGLPEASCGSSVHLRIYHLKGGYAVRTVPACRASSLAGIRLGDDVCQVIRPPLHLSPISPVCRRVGGFNQPLVFGQTDS